MLISKRKHVLTSTKFISLEKKNCMWENLFSFRKTKTHMLGQKFLQWKQDSKEKKLEIFKDDNLEKKKKRKTSLFFN